MSKKYTCSKPLQRGSYTATCAAELLKQFNFPGWAETAQLFFLYYIYILYINQCVWLSPPQKESAVCWVRLPQLGSRASLFPEWNCRSCHKKIAPEDQMKNSPLSPPHVSICWTFSISDTHSPLLPHFCHAQIPIAIKTVFVTKFDHGIPYLRTTAVTRFLQSSAAESTLRAKV